MIPLDEIKRKLFEHCKAFIQEIIENRECDIRLLYDAKKNVDLMMAFHKSGILDRYDVLEATWNVARKYEPDDIRNDSERESNIVLIWEFLPLDDILSELDLLPEEFDAPANYASNNHVYFKLSFSIPERVICLSLHLPEYGPGEAG
ncbi:MAG: hypothetical protein PWQ27_1567 [Kosmotoga sp.]|uniref:Uncharacterized protein n=1 Tax=Kosmotoga olearia (strain ATCC BAA-1733 / DSM 21960 / TBF 19.5.1) TaxID=521045 RepID=C5CDA9_KOSOT|nr:hypothetical protein Kole_1277 [Kosmotoga olearia TBF 19.5.1]MDK2954184.1 hypothetical protein [Kosmotoga sp.]